MQENQSKFRSVYPYETEMPRGHRFDSRISPTDFDSTLEWQGSRDLKCVTMTGTAVSRSLAKACNVGKMQIWPSCCSEALNLSIRLNSPAKPFLQACLVRLALLCPSQRVEVSTDPVSLVAVFMLLGAIIIRQDPDHLPQSMCTPPRHVHGCCVNFTQALDS